MIQSFKDKDTKSIWDGNEVKSLPQGVQSAARRKLSILDSAQSLRDIGALPGNKLEPMKSPKRRGQHSIRINDQFRICFTWTADGPKDVEIVDYHRERW